MKTPILLQIAILLIFLVLIVSGMMSFYSVTAQTEDPHPGQDTAYRVNNASTIYLPFVIQLNLSGIKPNETLTPTPAQTSAASQTLPPQSSATATNTRTPTPTSTRTLTPTQTPTPTGTATAILTSTPTATRTPTLSPISTRTPTLSPTAGFDPGVYVAVGPGLVDVIPHQIVRAANDRVYMFAVNGSLKMNVHSYWTTNPGLPAAGAGLTTGPQIVETSAVISVSTAYDGLNTIHVLVNLGNGLLKDYPFDVQTGTYRSAITIAPSAQNPAAATAALDAGTGGTASQFDSAGKLHVVYWSVGNAITHIMASYNPGTNVLTQETAPVQVDNSQGDANHPSLAVSPLDDSVTVAWISGITVPGKIFVRSRAANGAWDSAVQVNTADVWTSPNAGVNIDQGPSLLVDANGEKHLVYIENWRITLPYDYGRIHYVHWNGSAWSDQYINYYSHNPALAINAAGKLMIIAHGYPLNQTPACLSIDEMCVIVRNANGTWQPPSLFAAPPAGQSFDVSASVKWSVVGWNRPESIEFLFFSTPYEQPVLYYGRLGSNY